MSIPPPSSLNADYSSYLASPKPRYTGLLPPQAPQDRGRLTVILDMDETLLHSRFENVEEDYRQAEDRVDTIGGHDCVITFGDDERAYVHQRPFLQEFLRAVSEEFEPIVFTAALPLYANPVLDKVDRTRHVRHRLFRDSTVSYKGQPFVKDLKSLGRDMGRIVILDNNPFAMLATPDNAMPIASYFHDKSDTELRKALEVLRHMKDMDDIRPFLRKRFNFRKHLDDAMAAAEAEADDWLG